MRPGIFAGPFFVAAAAGCIRMRVVSLLKLLTCDIGLSRSNVESYVIGGTASRCVGVSYSGSLRINIWSR